MKHKYKISFLMAAHNEEKLISKSLNRLVDVYKDYPNMEILVGLDGCTDKTTEIVKEFSKKSKFIRYFELNEREGKQAVLDKLEPHIKGDIVIINDADWIFVYNSKKDLLDFLSLFDDPKIGGIAVSLDGEKSRSDFLKINSLGFLASAWGNHFLLKYNKEKFTKKKKDIWVYDIKKMRFIPWLDVYRKEAMDKTKHKSKLRAGDHVERTLRLLNSGYEVVSFNNENWPHINVSYNKQTVSDLINQRKRGIIAKKKIQSEYKVKISLFTFHFPFLFYVIKNSFKVKRLKDFIAIYTYLFAVFYAMSTSMIKNKISAKEIWNLRIKRD